MLTILNNYSHIDHSLAITGSGFQQERYFSHLEEIILSLFNREPLAEQPKYIAHMGCGDGLLLKKIHGTIRKKSVRGNAIKEFPLKLIGIDFDDKALTETTRTLKDIDYLVLKGDIGEPQKVIEDLKKMGIRDTDHILHLRSYPDIHLPVTLTSPSHIPGEKVRANISSETVYIDKEGNEISAATVQQNLTEHLKLWSSVIGNHGLINLEVHCLLPKTVDQFLDKSESRHINACHRFSRQLAVEADRFLLAAAEAGLFPDHDFSRKYPKSLPFCQVTLTLFKRREYRVRCARETDLPMLGHLEKQCWPPGLRRSVPVLKKRLQQYPKGQLVMENLNHSQIVGAIYSQRITHPDEVKKASMRTVEKLHREDGSYAQLLAVNILPEMQNRNLGDQLLEFMLQLCSLMSGVQKVIGVTRCSDYHKYADTPPQEYIHLRNPQGRIKDTNLRFHQLHGAQIKEPIANYRPRDKQNKGYGVLVEYDIFNRQRNDIQLNNINTGKAKKIRKTGETGKTKNAETFDSVNDFIVRTIVSILGREDGFSLERPLMEMGLDSAHLLELNEQIRFRFRIPLESTFFFQYNTAARIISYLQEQVVQEEKERKKEKENEEVTKTLDTTIRNSPTQKRDIAIIGIACRLPGGIENKEQLWELLINGKDAIGKMPSKRWSWPANIDPGQEHRGIDYGGFLDEIAHFDASFFRITPKEAELIDPQQRILLELSWECLEDACYPTQALAGSKTGVFIGASGSDYSRLLDRHPEDIDAHFCLGTSMAVLPNRISYFYDFNGPSLQIDTACSGSLAAVHEAVKSLLEGECRQALVGGIHIMCHPANSISYYKAGMLAKDGKCKTFDRDADGYGRGEGALMILLKPLEQALGDGDAIYAVIKGTAVNHGGQSGGLTVPNPEKQAALLIDAYKTSEVETKTIGYIEAHGTGTPLGDPIEINGLKQAFSHLAGKQEDTGKSFCGLGSIKTNIGHLEAAAGLAGLVKVVLGMQHQTLPASLNFNRLNPHINLANSPFYIVERNQPWKLSEGQLLRRAGVSSFGSGGTNAHVVLEEAPLIPESPDRKRSFPCYLMCLSAKTRTALRQKEQDLIRWLEKEGRRHNLFAVSAALLLGREHFNLRTALVVKDHREFREKLKEATAQEQANGYFKDIKDKDNPAGKMNQGQPLFAELSQAIIKELLPEKPINGSEYHDKLMALAELYINGYDADWKAFFPETARTGLRIDLPFYPFAGERFWVPKGREKNIGSSGTAAMAATASIVEDRPGQRTMCFLEKQWEPDSTDTIRESNPDIAILAGKETKGLAALVSRHFSGCDILFHQDIRAQLKQPEQQGKTYNGCVNLTGCASSGTGKDQSILMDRVVWLKQFIENKKGEREGLILLHVTRGLESFQNSAVNLSGALEAGLYRMLQSEYSHLRSRHMDADHPDEDKVLARQIATEFILDCEDPEICYRRGKRYRACLREFREFKESHEYRYQEGDGRDTSPTPRFPPDHVLWITGGTRGLGYLCARHFVSNYGVRKLVLTGQESPPPRDQWNSFQQQNTPIAQKIRGVQALEALGVQVQILAVPLADEQAIKKSLQQVKKNLGPIGGIIHCAGSRNLENPAFIRKSLAEIQQVLSPKKAGLDAMIHHFKHEPLQFFILFSSVSAIIPGFAPGNIDYAMANAYMDYAVRANLHACHPVSIQWPSWKETGMGEVKTRVYEQSGFLGLTDKEGLQLLDMILSRKMGPVVLPAVVDPARWKPHQLMRRTLQDTSSLKSRSPQSNARDPFTENPSSPTNDLREATEAALVSLFSRELKIKKEKLDVDTPFQDFGIDSILLAQLLQEINQLVQVDLDPSILMEYATIESFSAWLASTHADSLSRVLDMPVPGVPGLPKRDLQRPAVRQQAGHALDIAVIGLSCRFPGAPSLEEYWQLLAGGRSAIKPVPEERWGYANHFYAGLLDNITHFDPDFFLIPQEDARAMDPQALLLLEESLKLWYHAGYAHQEIKGKPVGVFLGGRSQHWPDEPGLAQARNPIVVAGQNYLAANISHFFDLHGPVLVLDTACSSALVAMHTAIQALRSMEIDCALVGGVSLLNTDKTVRMFQQRNLLSREPAFHIFDQRANGAVLGEGVGLVLLKTKEQAIKDGDRIYAVIKALAVNNDGRTAGPAAPNLNAQKQVMQTALVRSGKKPEEISYIEVNGSGSEVTDLLELKAIHSIYRSSAAAVPCGLGSMKPNIGHPLLAEGMAGFIKVILMLQHRQWVPFLSGQQPMKHYHMESSPFHFCRKLTPWPDAPTVAAINCFADGGTNAHVILEVREEPGSRPISRNPLPPPQLQRYDVRFPQVISAWKQKIMEE